MSRSSITVPSVIPSLTALDFICDTDSSPDTYRTLVSVSTRFLHISSSRVDLPIPGSPPTSTSEPFTMPPPRTLSSSPILVRIRDSSDEDTFFILVALGLSDTDTVLPDVFDFTVTFSSTNVFHDLQPGHCPSQRLDSYPHSLQKNICFSLATLFSFKSKNANNLLFALSV